MSGTAGRGESRTLAREVEVTAIPYGDRMTLSSGMNVIMAQSLGGSYTLITDMGYMVRLDDADADAIGETPAQPPSAEDLEGRSAQELCWDQLKSCYDPEIPVNIVDLGLVYSCELTAIGDDGDGGGAGGDGQKASVRFTLTAPGCGMGEVLKQDIERKLQGVPGVEEVDVQVAFDPPWDQSMMTEAARLQLGLM